MTTKEILQPFCAADDIRTYLNSIIKKGGYLYATNGHVMVSVPDDGTVITNPANDDQFKADPEKNFRRDGGIFVPLVFKEPIEKEKCRECLGSGKAHAKTECPECDGEGSFWHGSYSYDCKECDGTGEVSDGGASEMIGCKSCSGTGDNTTQPCDLPDGHRVNLGYIKKLATLPGIEYEPTEDRNSIIHFRFDGGVAALMPLWW